MVVCGSFFPTVRPIQLTNRCSNSRNDVDTLFIHFLSVSDMQIVIVIIEKLIRMTATKSESSKLTTSFSPNRQNGKQSCFIFIKKSTKITFIVQENCPFSSKMNRANTVLMIEIECRQPVPHFSTYFYFKLPPFTNTLATELHKSVYEYPARYPTRRKISAKGLTVC